MTRFGSPTRRSESPPPKQRYDSQICSNWMFHFQAKKSFGESHLTLHLIFRDEINHTLECISRRRMSVYSRRRRFKHPQTETHARNYRFENTTAICTTFGQLSSIATDPTRCHTPVILYVCCFWRFRRLWAIVTPRWSVCNSAICFPPHQQNPPGEIQPCGSIPFPLDDDSVWIFTKFLLVFFCGIIVIWIFLDFNCSFFCFFFFGNCWLFGFCLVPDQFDPFLSLSLLLTKEKFFRAANEFSKKKNNEKFSRIK